MYYYSIAAFYFFFCLHARYRLIYGTNSVCFFGNFKYFKIYSKLIWSERYFSRHSICTGYEGPTTEKIIDILLYYINNLTEVALCALCLFLTLYSNQLPVCMKYVAHKILLPSRIPIYGEENREKILHIQYSMYLQKMVSMQRN